MTLTTRLSLFFLGALAVVLAGFSTTVYFLARTHLERHAADRLEATLDTLTLVAEPEPGGLEWEPHERLALLDRDLGEGQVIWLVSTAEGEWVDGSGQFFGAQPRADSPLHQESEAGRCQTVYWQDQAWLVAQRHLQPRTSAGQAAAGQEKRLYASLRIKAGIALEPEAAALRQLALVLLGISGAIWVFSFGAGRWMCQQALLPVMRMAASARRIDAGDLTQRLPAAGTHDELEDLRRAFNELLARLQESFERQRRFTGDASHQLRTPLTAMLGQLEVAQRRERTTAEYQRVLASVQGQAEQLRHIVEMLLFLARADAEAKLPHLETIGLTEWLRGHLHTWSEHKRYADFRLESMSSTLDFVEAQTPLLGQLVDNLLENACKYSSPGTPILLRVEAQGGKVCFAVQDAGSGIAEEDLPHVFEPFFRSAQARQQGLSGTGLGLAIAARIAGALGGQISVMSRIGQGSCFTLALPSAQDRRLAELIRESRP